MKIHYLQHVPFEGPGTIEAWVRQRGHRLTGTHLYRQASLPTLDAVDWLIVMGGPMGVYDTGRFPWLEPETRFIRAAIDADKRVLGICLGAQLIAVALGARVDTDACREIGWSPVHLSAAALGHAALQGLPRRIEAFHWHSDTFQVPPGGVAAASSAHCANQMFVYGRRAVAVQFHLEMTPEGAERLIEHCAGNQRASLEHSLLGDEGRFAGLRTPLWRLLDNLQESD